MADDERKLALLAVVEAAAGELDQLSARAIEAHGEKARGVVMIYRERLQTYRIKVVELDPNAVRLPDVDDPVYRGVSQRMTTVKDLAARRDWRPAFRDMGILYSTLPGVPGYTPGDWPDFPED